MSRSIMFLQSDASAAADVVISQAEDHGDENELAFIEEVVAQLEEYLRAAKAGGDDE